MSMSKHCNTIQVHVKLDVVQMACASTNDIFMGDTVRAK